MEDNKNLTLDEYAKKAMTTCMPTCNNFSYMFINLVGEVGEFASKVAKHIRKEEASVGGEDVVNDLVLCGCETMLGKDVDMWEMELMKEAGDILWQLAGLCNIMGWDLSDVAQMNLDKLASRKQRNVIDGDGDNR